MDLLYNVINWIKEDWKTYPLRCFLEILAWFLSIACSITMMLTIPNVPFLYVYPLFIIQCLIFCWAAWTRKSSGMVANYILLVTIDTFALLKLIII